MQEGRQRQWTGRTGGGSIGQRLMLGFFRVFDVRVGYFFMAFSIPFYLVFHPSATRAIYSYFHHRLGRSVLRSCFGVWRNHILFGEMMLDRFSFYAGRGKAFRVDVVNLEAHTQLLNAPAGFVQAGAHIGNFEIAGYLLHQEQKKICSLIFGGEEAIVQINRNKALQSNNVETISVKEDLSHLFTIKTALERGDVVSMPCDRLFGSPKSIRIPFLGAPADFPLGPFMLAAQMNVEMIAIFVLKEKHLRYKTFVCPLSIDSSLYKNSRETAQALVAQYVLQMERILQDYPCQWFNFYDFWKSNNS